MSGRKVCAEDGKAGADHMGGLRRCLGCVEAGARGASGFMQLREITGKRMIITHLSNHTLGVCDHHSA